MQSILKRFAGIALRDSYEPHYNRPVPFQSFTDATLDPPVKGFLHLPETENGNALVLTHGAGANSQANLLVSVANAFADAGFFVLRCDLPFRQTRPFGPPFPTGAAKDREGLRQAVSVVRKKAAGKVFLGGHSYGGRQATMLVAENPSLVDGLLLLSYPLHPPKKPMELRTGHFASLNAPALFVHGTRDPFGSPEEMKAALKLIPGRNLLMEVERGGHDLLAKAAKPKKADIKKVDTERAVEDLPSRIVREFQIFFND